MRARGVGWGWGGLDACGWVGGRGVCTLRYAGPEPIGAREGWGWGRPRGREPSLSLRSPSPRPSPPLPAHSHPTHPPTHLSAGYGIQAATRDKFPELREVVLVDAESGQPLQLKLQ